MVPMCLQFYDEAFTLLDLIVTTLGHKDGRLRFITTIVKNVRSATLFLYGVEKLFDVPGQLGNFFIVGLGLFSTEDRVQFERGAARTAGEKFITEYLVGDFR